MESFFHTLKVELAHQRRRSTRDGYRPQNRPNDKLPTPVSTASGGTSAECQSVLNAERVIGVYDGLDHAVDLAVRDAQLAIDE